MCIKGQHGKDIASQGLWEKFTRRAERNCLVKRQKEKRSDKEFSIIPYHSACPCEYPCVATFAPKKAVAGSTAVHLNHQSLKCKQWHIAHRLLLTEEGGIMQKKPLQRRLQGYVMGICAVAI